MSVLVWESMAKTHTGRVVLGYRKAENGPVWVVMGWGAQQRVREGQGPDDVV